MSDRQKSVELVLRHTETLALSFWALALVGAIVFKSASPGAILDFLGYPISERVIEIEAYPRRPWPIKIVAVRVAGRQVETRIPFRADENWLRDLSLVIVNSSTSDIVATEIGFDFPDTRTDLPRIFSRVGFGQVPQFALATADGRFGKQPNEDALLFAAGETQVVALGPRYPRILRNVEQRVPIRKLHRCVLRLRQAYFANGDRWSPMMGYEHPDYSQPGKYVQFDPVDSTTGRLDWRPTQKGGRQQ